MRGATQVSAAVLREGASTFALETLTIDAPAAGEVLVRIAGVGICHTDLGIRHGVLPFPLPAILGHEGSGIVEQVGEGVTHLQPGDPVVLSFAACGRCSACGDAHPAYCSRSPLLNLSGSRAGAASAYVDARGSAVNGRFFGQSSFASHALVDASCAVRIPADVPVELMGPLGCGLQTGAGAIINVLRPKAGSSVVMFGAGAVGLAGIMAARAAGCGTLVAVDRHDARLQTALELGATHTINPEREDLDELLRGIARRGVDFSLECTGHPALLRKAVEILRPGGSCALVGTSRAGTELKVDAMTLLNGRNVHGVIEGDSVPAEFIPQLIAMWRSGAFPFDRLVRFYALEQINEAVADVEAARVVKAVLRPQAPAFHKN